MKHPFIFTFLCILVWGCQSHEVNTKEISNKAHQQANKMAEFIVKRNADSLISLNYPRLIQLSGGKDKIIEYMRKIWKKYDDDGVKILSIQVDNPPKMVYYHGLYQCTISQTMVMQKGDKKVEVKSAMIGLSTDNGNKWYFLDVTSQKLSNIKATLPEISNELEIPESKATLLKNSN